MNMTPQQLVYKSKSWKDFENKLSSFNPKKEEQHLNGCVFSIYKLSQDIGLLIKESCIHQSF
jgi:hypothetical protein